MHRYFMHDVLCAVEVRLLLNVEKWKPCMVELIGCGLRMLIAIVTSYKRKTNTSFSILNFPVI